jgi:hypothetical protein
MVTCCCSPHTHTPPTHTQGEKEASGLPDAPSSASGKLLEVEYAAIGDRKLRGQLRDAGGIEAQVTALQVRRREGEGGVVCRRWGVHVGSRGS